MFLGWSRNVKDEAMRTAFCSRFESAVLCLWSCLLSECVHNFGWPEIVPWLDSRASNVRCPIPMRTTQHVLLVSACEFAYLLAVNAVVLIIMINLLTVRSAAEKKLYLVNAIVSSKI